VRYPPDVKGKVAQTFGGLQSRLDKPEEDSQNRTASRGDHANAKRRQLPSGADNQNADQTAGQGGHEDTGRVQNLENSCTGLIVPGVSSDHRFHPASLQEQQKQ